MKEKIGTCCQQQAEPPWQRRPDINQVFADIALSTAHVTPLEPGLKRMKQSYQLWCWRPAHHVTKRVRGWVVGRMELGPSPFMPDKVLTM
jgi:hypothetical protein